MKNRLLAFLSAVLLLTAQLPLVAPVAQAQTFSRASGRFVASAYNWRSHVFSSIAAGATSVTLDVGTPMALASNALQEAPFVTPPSGGTFPSLIFQDSNSETVSVSGSTGCGFGASTSSGSLGACVLTVGATASAHGAGAVVGSGTFGLQEALNAAALAGGGLVVVDGSWTTLGGTTAMLSAAVFPSTVMVEDLRGSTPQYWVERPSAVTQISAPSAPTVTTVTGSLSSGAYRVMVAYVDALGGVSLASTDSTQTATTTGLSIASPAASTGAVGYLPYITAAGGGTGTEILAKAAIDSTICTLTALESVVPACAIGATAVVTAANPSSTAKPVVESTAFSTYAPQPFSSVPLPFNSNYPFGIFVVGGTLNSGATANEDLAQFQVPAGFFNQLGKTVEVCVKGATATQVASSTLTVTLSAAAQYAQSPVTIATAALPTQTQAAAGTFGGCFILHTAVTGSSGKFWTSSSGPFVNFLNSVPGTQVVAEDASAAASSAVDLTKQLWFAVNAADGTANNITGPIINSVSIRVIQ